jgi:hypothetical protein
MATQYHEIEESEMESFMDSKGFQRITLPNTTEIVYGKVISPRVTLRVYSSILESKHGARGNGEDAIRCVLVAKQHNDEIRIFHTSMRVHRVKGWKKNLENRMKETSEVPVEWCSCGRIMILRENKAKKSQFWGCSGYPECRVTKQYPF